MTEKLLNTILKSQSPTQSNQLTENSLENCNILDSTEILTVSVKGAFLLQNQLILLHHGDKLSG